MLDLPLTIERKTVTHLMGAGRTTAIVHLEGSGEHGYGEEVTFQAADLLAETPRGVWPFAGSFRDFSLWLASRDLFEHAPQYDVVLNYRHWAFEGQFVYGGGQLPLLSGDGQRAS